MIVLDSSAILAYLNDEPGGESVEDAFASSVISAVNYSEVAQKLALRSNQMLRILEELHHTGLVIEPFGEDDALNAAALFPLTKEHGLSIADRACLALAQRLSASVLTADRVWAKLDIGLQISVIR